MEKVLGRFLNTSRIYDGLCDLKYSQRGTEGIHFEKCLREASEAPTHGLPECRD